MNQNTPLSSSEQTLLENLVPQGYDYVYFCSDRKDALGHALARLRQLELDNANLKGHNNNLQEQHNNQVATIGRYQAEATSLSNAANTWRSRADATQKELHDARQNNAELHAKATALEVDLKTAREFSPKLPEGVTTDGVANIWMRKDGYSTFGSVSYYLNLDRALQNANARADEWQNKCAAAEKRSELLQGRLGAWTNSMSQLFGNLDWTYQSLPFPDYVVQQIKRLQDSVARHQPDEDLLRRSAAWGRVDEKFFMVGWPFSNIFNTFNRVDWVCEQIDVLQRKAATLDNLKDSLNSK